MLLDDIASLLQSGNVGTVGVNLFMGEMPAAPGDCVALFEYAGQQPELHVEVDRPGLQARVRNASYVAGRTKAAEVYRALHGQAEITVNGMRYHLIAANHPPTFGWYDDVSRPIFVINFRIIKGRE